jgi:hypothetical protein
MGRRSDGQSSQPAPAEEAAQDDRYPYSEGISDHIPRVGVRTGGVSSVRVVGPRAPTDVQTPDGLGSGGGGTQPTNIDRPVQDFREETKRLSWERWRSQLLEEDAARRHRAVRAVLPNWDRSGVPLTFRMTQVFTGHGVCGEYLLRTRRKATSTCHHCEEKEDTAKHTLEFCLAWEEPRRVPASRHRRKVIPRCGRRGHDQGPTGVSRRPHLLRVSHAREGVSGEKQREEGRPRQGGSPKRTDTPPWDRGTTTAATILGARVERAVTPKRICATAHGTWH